MSSLTSLAVAAEVTQVQNLHSYAYKVDWNVATDLKLKEKKLDTTSADFVFLPLFDSSRHEEEELICSDELTSCGDGNDDELCSTSSQFGRPKTHFQSFIELTGKGGVNIFAKLKSDKYEFEIGSAGVRFKEYAKKPSGYSFLLGTDEDFLVLENVDKGPAKLETSTQQEDEGKFVHWVSVELDPESYYCFSYLHFSFVIHSKVEAGEVVPLNCLPQSSVGFAFPLASYLFSAECSDAIISCGLKEFPVHKVILYNKSSVLKSAFESPMKEKETGKLTIDDFEPEIVEEFLRFLYTGSVKELAKNAAQLFLIADKYDVPDLKILIQQSILEILTVGNVVELYGAGKACNSALIVRRSVEKIKMEKWLSGEELRAAGQKFPDLICDIIDFE